MTGFRLVPDARPTLSVAACRALDGLAIELGIPGLLLMENAARGAAGWIWELLAERPADGELVALIGAGNNGGDALAICRMLHVRDVPVRGLLVAEGRIRADGDAGANLRMARAVGVPLEPARPDALAGARLLVDGLLGSGLAGPPREPFAALIAAANASEAPVFALDVPSGLDGDRGEPLGAAIRARWTAAFAAATPGLWRPEARPYVGELQVIDIGVPGPLYEQAARRG